MSTRWRKVFAVGVVTALAGAVTVMVSATTAFADAAITSAGPLTSIGISSDLNCSVNHTGDIDGEWFGNTACGTFLASAGTLYGPANVPAGGSASPRTTWTPVSQSTVTGTGTTADPFKVVTVDSAGTSGLQVTETDTYVAGQESYRNDVIVTNTAGTAATGVFYRGGDCFLQNSDFGFGIFDSPTGAITCTTSLDPGSRIEQMLPLTAGSNYFEGFYNALWTNIGTQNELPNTCDCSIDEDNSIGLSWPVSLGAGASKTYSSIVTFSPVGALPVTLAKTADTGTVAAGSTDGYTITATNTNAVSVTLTALTDTLGAGFSYRAGTTTGAVTTDPTISGQTLSWGPITVPGDGSATLHFGVTAPSSAGTYTDDAEGSATGFTIVGTGPAAPVTVTAAATPTTLTTSQSGGGQSGATITVPVGTAVTDSAVLSGANAATAGGTVSYNLYSNSTCTTLVTAAGGGTVVAGSVPNSSPETLSVAGTYYWTATYSGDANNVGSSSTCSESVTVTPLSKASPTIVTTPSASVPAGGNVSDSAALAGGSAPTGTITFTLFGPTDTTCTATPVSTKTVTVTGNGTYGSGNVTAATAGTYRWTAAYGGDANNNPVASACGTETVVVTPVVTSPAPVVDDSSNLKGTSTLTDYGLTTSANGDLVVAYVAADGPSTGGQSITVSGSGLAWTRVAQQNGALGDSEVWVANAGTKRLITVSVTAAKRGYGLILTDATYKNATGIGARATFTAHSGSPSGTIVTTQANSWVWAVGNDWLAAKNRTVGPGQRLFNQVLASSGDTFWVQSTLAPTPTAGTNVTINDTAPTTDPYNLVIIEIL